MLRLVLLAPLALSLSLPRHCPATALSPPRRAGRGPAAVRPSAACPWNQPTGQDGELAGRGRKYVRAAGIRRRGGPGGPSRRPAVTRLELGLYQIAALLAVPFRRLRSHWVSRVTADTENKPLIGLPNQHIVGLTYVP
ncbi:hypothetical protein GCM10010389_49470 [Streptomyces echinoruber]|uniref:Uncharacterized protein n=1 Tax=Streptomyces echinoruber TaxID=68898 RepID=A0A918RLD3_9ACTN|nr:hypothetical protein GCM10010389_49470 [Streptomyces echinoruber]